MLFFSLVIGCASQRENNTPANAKQGTKRLTPPDLPPDLVKAEVISLNNNTIWVQGLTNDENKDEGLEKVIVHVNQSTQYLIHEGENKYRKGRIEI